MKRFVTILLCALLLTGCGSKAPATINSNVEDTSVQAKEIVTSMINNFAMQRNIGMFCGTTDSTMKIIQSCEMYADLDNDIYHTIYLDDVTDADTIYQVKLDQANKIEYTATKYGWLKTESFSEYRSIFTDFFNFLNLDNLQLVTDKEDIEVNSGINYDDYNIVEETSQSEDKNYIFYTSIFINKETNLPDYISVQMYDKSSDDSGDSKLVVEEEDGTTAYANVLMSGKIYSFAYYKPDDEEHWNFYQEAIKLPDETITEEEYNEQAWKDTGEENEKDN